MSRSSHLETQHRLVIHRKFAHTGRKKLLGLIGVSFFLVIVGFGMVVTGKDQNIWKGWITILLFGICLMVFLTQLMREWKPLLEVDAQGIRICRNAFIKSILLEWSEITTITLFKQNQFYYLGFSLSPDCLETFLQRQSFFARKIIERRLNRSHMVALLPQRSTFSSLRAALASIEKRYQTFLQESHIAIQTSPEEN